MIGDKWLRRVGRKVLWRGLWRLNGRRRRKIDRLLRRATRNNVGLWRMCWIRGERYGRKGLISSFPEVLWHFLLRFFEVPLKMSLLLLQESAFSSLIIIEHSELSGGDSTSFAFEGTGESLTISSSTTDLSGTMTVRYLTN